MSLINKKLANIALVVKIYKENYLSEFERTTKDITNTFKDTVDELASEFNLLSDNSVRQIKHYSFISRVKEPDSLSEKFVRNNLINDFSEVFSGKLKKEDLTAQIGSQLPKIDDIIGVKILTDLRIDCEKMHNLIKSAEFVKKAEIKGILLDMEVCEKQPVLMKNGLEIYKIPGTFNNKYNFELQIKSKIISAWGDMEHGIFYKDYAISPVRDTAQTSMNHVGKLLMQIDDFVESIRSANDDYTKNAEALQFMQLIEDNYSPKIKTKLRDTSFSLNSISELLFATSKIIENFDKAKDPIFKHLELQITDEGLNNKYLHLRNKLFDLQILESIIISWLPNTEDITPENINRVITEYLNLLIKATTLFIIERIQAYDIDDLEEIILKVKGYYEIGLKYNCLSKFILNLNKFTEFIDMTIDIDELFEDKEQEASVLKNVLFIHLNKGDLEAYSKELEEEVIVKLLIAKIAAKFNNDSEKKQLSIEFDFISQKINQL